MKETGATGEAGFFRGTGEMDMELLAGLGKQIYLTFVSMAPYLMLGLGVSGVLHVLVRKDLIARHLGGDSFSSVIKAAIVGVPLPLCSCGVLPLALSLRRSRASDGATVSFLISTPQTGVDSLIATWGLLGLPFAVLRAVSAFAMGIAGGAVASVAARFGAPSRADQPLPSFSCALCFDKTPHSHSWGRRIKGMVRYAFGDFLDDISLHLVIGVVISGLIAYFVPKELFTAWLNNEVLTMLVMIAAGIPLYICATASIPIAMVLMIKGVSPGAAFVFLTAGPATNAASIVLIGHVMGRKMLAVYLGSIAVFSVLAGMGINALFRLFDYRIPVARSGHLHEHVSPAVLAVSAVFAVCVALSLLRSRAPGVWGKMARRFRRGKGAAPAADRECSLTVEGMTCANCGRKVNAAIRGVPGVTAVGMNIETKQVKVSGSFSRALVREAIEKAGYRIRD
jgi:uncharacterized membrane protein YraQ (UPF0718 family)/copper chaperone CopZ